MTEYPSISDLNWLATAPGPDPTARFTAEAVINGQLFKLVAHRVQRPVAAGWVIGEFDEGEAYSTDGTMAIDGPAWKKWHQEWASLTDEDDWELPEPPALEETAELEAQHENLWKALGTSDHSAFVWKRSEGAYLIYGWAIDDTPGEALPTCEVQLDYQEESGWYEGTLSVEGTLCNLNGPAFRWDMRSQKFVPAYDHEFWVAGVSDAIGTSPALMPTGQASHRFMAVVATLYEGHDQIGKWVEPPDRPTLHISCREEAQVNGLRAVFDAIKQRKLHLVDGRAALIVEDEMALESMHRIGVVYATPNRWASTSLITSSEWIDDVGFAFLGGMALSALDALNWASVEAAGNGGLEFDLDHCWDKNIAPEWVKGLPTRLMTQSIREARKKMDSAIQVLFFGEDAPTDTEN